MRATSEHNRGPAPEKTAAGKTNRAALRAGGIAVIAAGPAGIAMFTLELMGPVLGFDDTDNPAVSRLSASVSAVLRFRGGRSIHNGTRLHCAKFCHLRCACVTHQ